MITLKNIVENVYQRYLWQDTELKVNQKVKEMAVYLFTGKENEHCT